MHVFTRAAVDDLATVPNVDGFDSLGCSRPLW